METTTRYLLPSFPIRIVLGAIMLLSSSVSVHASGSTSPERASDLLASCPFTARTIERAVDFVSYGLGDDGVWLVGWGVPPDADATPQAATPPGATTDSQTGNPFVTPSEQDIAAGSSEDGWLFKGLWIMSGSIAGVVTIEGGRQDTGNVLQIALGTNPPDASVQLDPLYPGIPPQRPGWLEWPSYLYFTTTGCYEMTASWEGGSWMMTIPFVTPEDLATLTTR